MAGQRSGIVCCKTVFGEKRTRYQPVPEVPRLRKDRRNRPIPLKFSAGSLWGSRFGAAAELPLGAACHKSRPNP
jgi:hypothetical protein